MEKYARLNSTNIHWAIGAGDECKLVLQSLGFNYVSVKKQRGSHSAEIWMPDEDKERFEKEILHNTIVGEYRKFFFSQSHYMDGHPSIYYYVSYHMK